VVEAAGAEVVAAACASLDAPSPGVPLSDSRTRPNTLRRPEVRGGVLKAMEPPCRSIPRRPFSPVWGFGDVIAAAGGGLCAGGVPDTVAPASEGIAAPMSAEARRLRVLTPTAFVPVAAPSDAGWKGGAAPNAGVARGGLGWYAGIGEPSLCPYEAKKGDRPPPATLSPGLVISAISVSPDSPAFARAVRAMAPSVAALAACLVAVRTPILRFGFHSSDEEGGPFGSIDVGVNLEGLWGQRTRRTKGAGCKPCDDTSNPHLSVTSPFSSAMAAPIRGVLPPLEREDASTTGTDDVDFA